MNGICRLAGFGAALGVGLVGLGGGSARADTLASSTFDSDLSGWTSNTPAQVSWSATGGNPGGYAMFTDATGDSTYIYAPSSFLGNYISEGVTSISFDDNIFSETGVEAVGQYEVDLSGPGGSAIWLGSQPSSSYPTGWVNVTSAISDDVSPPSGWTVENGSWLGLLGDVTQVGIPIELVSNYTIPGDTDIEGIDNVTLSGTAIPEPASVSLMLAGLLGLAWLRRRRPDF